MKRSPRTTDLLELLLSLAIVGLVLFIGSFLRLRADLTNEQRYTLTPATKQMLEELPDVVYVKVYLTGELPADLERFSRSIRELLDEMRVVNPEKVQYSFIDPSASADEKTRKETYDQLQKEGLQYSSIRIRDKESFSERIVFPGALITFRDRTVPVQLLKTQLRTPDADIVNRSINNLEYELASAFRQSTQREKARIAFIEGHGELRDMEVADITNALGELYEVKRVKVDEQLDALSHTVPNMRYRLNDYDAIIVAKPDSAFSPRCAYILDQFIMNGGKALWLIDPMNANLDSLRKNQFSMAVAKEIGLDDLFFNYGVRFNKDLVLDRSCAPIELYTQPYGNQRKLERFPWYFEPVLIPQSTHPIVSNIDPVHLRFASSLDTVGTDSVRKTILLTSSPASLAQRNPVRVSLNIVEVPPPFERQSTPHMPMAVLVEGRFRSAFSDRLPTEFINDPSVGFREKGAPTAQIMVGDGDVIGNRVDQAKGMYFTLGFDRYANSKIYGNREFIINAMNYLLDDRSLISIRSRTITLRQLDPDRIVVDRGRWQLFNTALPVIIAVLLGLAFQAWRRRQVTRNT
ncbi:MAG: gliding motility-associated ABC transporter substrate-binding protein GldG [Flavobacteriales bacterium]|jgi:gliding-associated putative ABC transporter substrate-binding component GldG|nr:gliding motility-associated ABC transporter substrate-binding protein GldG [Flavobacteriales bacterium]